ncbi:hypothetical protein HYALB_00011125 [Hymenoscyphus albidus]|uniref:Uncharacterized protein n=1 Tax=Hymenoscyphus albidus TaxID=595503 RepID=A0A9N9LI29_9HELO|nr:hypothetical protein HYALB_00011125 [Hymenoscyphus albidus]
MIKSLMKLKQELKPKPTTFRMPAINRWGSIDLELEHFPSNLGEDSWGDDCVMVLLMDVAVKTAQWERGGDMDNNFKSSDLGNGPMMGILTNSSFCRKEDVPATRPTTSVSLPIFGNTRVLPSDFGLKLLKVSAHIQIPRKIRDLSLGIAAPRSGNAPSPTFSEIECVVRVECLTGFTVQCLACQRYVDEIREGASSGPVSIRDVSRTVFFLPNNIRVDEERFKNEEANIGRDGHKSYGR